MARTRRVFTLDTPVRERANLTGDREVNELRDCFETVSTLLKTHRAKLCARRHEWEDSWDVLCDNVNAALATRVAPSAAAAASGPASVFSPLNIEFSECGADDIQDPLADAAAASSDGDDGDDGSAFSDGGVSADLTSPAPVAAASAAAAKRAKKQKQHPPPALPAPKAPKRRAPEDMRAVWRAGQLPKVTAAALKEFLDARGVAFARRANKRILAGLVADRLLADEQPDTAAAAPEAPALAAPAAIEVACRTAAAPACGGEVAVRPPKELAAQAEAAAAAPPAAKRRRIVAADEGTTVVGSLGAPAMPPAEAAARRRGAGVIDSDGETTAAGAPAAEAAEVLPLTNDNLGRVPRVSACSDDHKAREWAEAQPPPPAEARLSEAAPSVRWSAEVGSITTQGTPGCANHGRLRPEHSPAEYEELVHRQLEALKESNADAEGAEDGAW